MREKVRKLVVSFSTTTHALAAENYFKAQQISGRLIPLPESISAECGLAWCTEISQKEQLEVMAEQKKICIQGIHEIMLYDRK